MCWNSNSSPQVPLRSSRLMAAHSCLSASRCVSLGFAPRKRMIRRGLTTGLPLEMGSTTATFLPSSQRHPPRDHILLGPSGTDHLWSTADSGTAQTLVAAITIPIDGHDLSSRPNSAINTGATCQALKRASNVRRRPRRVDSASGHATFLEVTIGQRRTARCRYGVDDYL